MSLVLQEDSEDYDDELENEVTLTIPQTKHLLCDYKFPLFVAGFGSGKTLGLCVNALNDLINFPGSNIGVYAPTYDLLKLVAMSYIEEKLIAGGFYYTLNNSNHIFNVDGFGQIICRSMDNPAKIVGYETFRAHCDELDILGEDKARLAWNKIIARNRQKVYQFDDLGKRIPMLDENNDYVLKNKRVMYETEMNRVSAYTTPEGFGFVYQRWEKEDDPDGLYGIIRASTYSNEHNLPDDYISTLIASYPAELIEAYINGEFVNLTSGRVYRKFDRKLNGSTETVGSSGYGRETLYVGMDFNVEHGAASIHVLRDGTLPAIQDLHCVDQIHDSYDTDDTIRILNEKYPTNPIKIYPDATGKKRSSASGSPSSTDLAKLKSAGFDIVVDYSNPLIKDRINCVNAKVCNGKNERHYFVNPDTAPDVCETLEKQVYDNNGMPDKSSGLDHQGDGVGYLITKMFPIVRENAGFLKVKRRN